MLFKNKQILEMNQALRQVDNFKFAGIFRYTLAKNLRRLSEAVSDLEETRKKLGADRKMWKTDEKGAPIPDKNEDIKDFENEWTKLLNAETEIVLTMITIKDLDLDVNAIPVTVLAAIDCLIKE